MTDSINSLICLRPFYSLELNIRGDVSVCCPAWSKGFVGNAKKKSLLEIWNDEPIRHVRRMMLEGRWEKICRPGCPVIMRHRIQKVGLPPEGRHMVTDDVLSAVVSGRTVLKKGPTWINFANSTTCNLNCIMCGREHFRDDDALMSKVMAEVQPMLPDLKEIFLTGNGDPFARPDTRNFMLDLDSSNYPDLKINLLTNGLLLPKYWERIRHLNFGVIDISVDAATGATYEKIRRGGQWEDLLQALEVVGDNRDRFSHAGINMTVMRDNFREIPSFVELAGRYGLGAGINRIRGKWGDQNFFTFFDRDLVEELKSVIAKAEKTAAKLNVPFNTSSFCDIMAGKTTPRRELYLQMASDTARQLFYRLKALQKRKSS